MAQRPMPGAFPPAGKERWPSTVSAPRPSGCSLLQTLGTALWQHQQAALQGREVSQLTPPWAGKRAGVGLELLRGGWGYLKQQVQDPEAGAQACPGGQADRVIADHTAKAGRGGPIPVSQHRTAALGMCGQEREVRGLKRRKESQVLPGA